MTRCIMRSRMSVLAVVSTLVGSAWANVAEVVSLSGRGEVRPPQENQWREARVQQRLQRREEALQHGARIAFDEHLRALDVGHALDGERHGGKARDAVAAFARRSSSCCAANAG